MKKCFNKKELHSFVDSLSTSIEKDCDTSLCILGIRKGGAPLADAIAEKIRKKKKPVDIGYIDVSLYRDDIHRRLPDGPMEGTDIDFTLENRTVVLVDSVLWTGRTIRAAIDHVMALGRPHFIKLAVLVDREGRELPIQADYYGVKIDNPGEGKILVQYEGTAEDGIYFVKNKKGEC